MNLWTTTMNGMEADLWATPSNDDMEADSGQAPYSIPFFINEFANGLQPGITTKMKIDPTSKTRWKPVVAEYNAATVDDAILDTTNTAEPNKNPLFRAFGKARMQTHFHPMPMFSEFGTASGDPRAYAASLRGCLLMEQSLRGGQDQFVKAGRRDGSFAPMYYADVPVEYIRYLDYATVYPTNSGKTAGAAAEMSQSTDPDGNALTDPEASAPRYYQIHGDYACKVIHSDRYFFRKNFQPSKQPFTTVSLVDIWHNNLFRSLQRHAVIAPQASTSLTIDPAA